MQPTSSYARRLAAIGIAVCLAGLSGRALPQVQRSGGGANAASAQLAQQYQQAESERAALKADNDKLKKQLDDVKKQLDAAQGQLKKVQAGTSASASQLAAAQAASQRDSQQLEQSKTKMQDLLGRFRETAVTLRGVESDRTQAKQDLAKSQSELDRCAERNYQLYQLADELLDRYEHQSALSYMEKAEPFTRIKRTQIENAVDEYRQRAQELQIQRAQREAGAKGATDTPVQFTAPPAPADDAPTGTKVPKPQSGSPR